MITRREALLTIALVVTVAACSKKAPPVVRCAQCGMAIDPASPWRAEAVDGSAEALETFDSPKCALLRMHAWPEGGTGPVLTIRVQDFYDREWHDAAALRYAIGSDVVGPMGADVVPVDPARAAKFAADHKATRVVSLVDLDVATLRSL